MENKEFTRLKVGDIVEYATRKWYVSAFFADALENEDVDYVITPIKTYFDGHATYYSFDSLGDDLIINRKKLNPSTIIFGDLGFISNIYPG